MGRAPPALAIAAVLLLTAIAGCSVLIDGDTGSTPVPTTPTPSDDAPEPTPSPTDTGESDSTPPASVVESTDPDSQYTSFNAAAVNTEHTSRLEQAGSFTTQSSLIIQNSTHTRYINGTYAVEYNGPALNVANITFIEDGTVQDFPTTTRYTSDGRTYERRIERTDEGTETSYYSGQEPYSASDPQPVNTTVAYTIGQIAHDVIETSAWNQTGSGEPEGAEVIRYDTSGGAFGVDRFGNVDGAATFVIDTDGVVRYVSYQFTASVGGEPTAYRYTAGYTNVGETTVEEPSWTDQA